MQENFKRVTKVSSEYIFFYFEPIFHCVVREMLIIIFIALVVESREIKLSQIKVRFAVSFLFS